MLRVVPAGLELDRFVVADGIDIWIAVGDGVTGHRFGVASDLLEIDAQIVGESTYWSHHRGPRPLGRGHVSYLEPGETFGVDFGGRERFVAIGVTVDPLAVGCTESERDLRAVHVAEADASLLALFDEVYRARRDGAAMPLETIATTVRRHVQRVCTISAPDPCARARRLLEEHFDTDLYLRHIADEVGMTEPQLLRRFARRYGCTPVRYRCQVRLARACRVAWSQPELTIADVARRTGFHHIGYFHRSYRTAFGTTPTAHRANARARS